MCSDGVLSDRAGELVIKPCKQSEIDFYESTSSHSEFAAYIPTYFGELHLGADSHQAQVAGAVTLPPKSSPQLPGQPDTSSATGTEKTWSPSNGGKIQTDLAIVLENVAVDFKKPNILDVKLGARLWADDAPAAKRARLDKAAEETTSKPLGFRIAGMKTYLGDRATTPEGLSPDGYKIYDKMYGRSFNVETVRQGFEDYFLLEKGVKAKGALRKVIRRLMDDLRGMAAAIEKEESRMYSASLLFVYEGDTVALEDAFAKEKDVLASVVDKRGSNCPRVTNGSGNGQENGTGAMSEPDVDGDGSGDSDSVEEIKFPAIQNLKLIDFAHAEWTPGHGPDKNILHGINNVIDILAGLAG